MQCQHCRREITEGEAVYRLSLFCGHPWAMQAAHWDMVVRYVCGTCCDPTKVSWLQGREWRLPMSCKGCGRSIIHDTVRKVPKHVVCGPECRMAVYARHARERRKKRERPCQNCGKPFVPKRADALTCSSPCRQRAYRLRRLSVASLPDVAMPPDIDEAQIAALLRRYRP